MLTAALVIAVVAFAVSAGCFVTLVFILAELTAVTGELHRALHQVEAMLADIGLLERR